MTPSKERSSPLGMFLLGLLFGAAASGIGVYVWQQREMQRRNNALEAEWSRALKSGQERPAALHAPGSEP